MTLVDQSSAPAGARGTDYSNAGGQDMRQATNGRQTNVNLSERHVSLAAGTILALLGLGRRDLTGLAIAGVGGALIYRGAAGHCPLYQTLGIDTARPESDEAARRRAEQ